MSFVPADRVINVAQVGGIERYVIDDGLGRGVRALCVNTGAGLRYRVLVDRGLDIDQASFNQHSLAFLTHKGVTAPTRGLDQGAGWLKSFGGGLLTGCGPFGMGAPVTDQGEELGLHGPHSNSAGSVEGVFQPCMTSGDPLMTIVGRVRYGALYGPCVELKRTIHSWLGKNVIAIEDEFQNHGNQDVPHAWLLHINFGWPLVDEGTELCVDAERVEIVAGEKEYWAGQAWKRMTGPREDRRGNASVVGYLYPRASADGKVTVGIVNPRLGFGVAIRYDAREFPRLVNWQHLGPGEYVTALEPSNGGVEGRDKDRARGWLDTLKAGGKKVYRYELEVVGGREMEAVRLIGKIA
jgi:hypothetical protein